MKSKLLLLATLAILLPAHAPANAGVWSVIGGVCFNPAGHAIPLTAAIHNPHCGSLYQPPVDPPTDPKDPPGKKKPVQHAKSNAGAVGMAVTGCFISGAASVMIASSTMPGRQLTPREATMAIAAGCPLFAPFILLQGPDNPATYEVARRARNFEKSLACEFEMSRCMGMYAAAYHQAYTKGTIPKGLP